MFITESNDRISTLAPDEKNLLGQFLDILREDRVLGGEKEKTTGQAVCPGWLSQLRIRSYSCLVQGEFYPAAEGEQQQKEDIFQTFFSYLPEDVEILLAEAG